MKLGIVTPLLAVLVITTGCQKDVKQTRLPSLCVRQAQWPELVTTMQGFALANDLSFHGGIEPATDGEERFNAYVARGHSFWLSDDFDLWIVSHPYRAGTMTYNALSKAPWTVSDGKLARDLEDAIKPLRCGEVG